MTTKCSLRPFKTVVASAVVVMMGALLVTGCGREQAGTAPSDVVDGEVPAGAPVTVTGEVERLYDGRTFTMTGDQEWFTPDLVVVSRNAVTPPLTGDTRVRVTGRVHKLAVYDIERELGWDFDPQVKIELEKVESYLVADKVEVIGAD